MTTETKTDGSPLRVELGPLPPRLRELPVFRGYPVPWFVQWIDGEPEFRCMDSRKWVRAVQEKLCWVCGQRLGAHLSFTVGPMCLVTGTSSEPPAHFVCATWSAKHCPFLTKPKMVRRENDLPEEIIEPAGCGLTRNPGATAIYTVRSYQIFNDGNGRPLIHMSEEWESCQWYREGREATMAEVMESTRTGLPFLLEMAEKEGPEAVAALEQQIRAFERLVLKSFTG
jgi:hypothetical protein